MRKPRDHKNPPLISPAPSRKKWRGGPLQKSGVTEVFKATDAAKAMPLQQGKLKVKAQTNNVKMSGVERAEQNQQAASIGQTNKRMLRAGLRQKMKAEIKIKQRIYSSPETKREAKKAPSKKLNKAGKEKERVR